MLERNRFYRGDRPHHVDRFVVDLTLDAASVLDRVERNELDYGWVPQLNYAERAAELRGKYGINKSRFWVVPANNLRMFALNTSRPLFRNNPKLRQAINFAVDRKALLRERGPLGGTLTDQYLPPGLPGFRDERIYPLKAPDLGAGESSRPGQPAQQDGCPLYGRDPPRTLSGADHQGQPEQDRARGRDQVVSVPGLASRSCATPGEPFDIGRIGWIGIAPDGSLLNWLFDGRTIANAPDFGNFSYFNSPKYNRALAQASRIPTGAERYRTYGELDVDIARNAAPAIAVSYDNTPTLVSARTGCVIVNPELDLAAVCLK